MPRRNVAAPAPPWVQLRHHQDRLTDPPRLPPPPLRGRTRTTLPARGRCRACGRVKFTGGSLCGRRACPGYLELWLGDQRARLVENLAAYGGPVFQVTLTAPGADVLPWDRERCRHPARERCSGERGCRVGAEHASRWNQGWDRRFSLLWDAAAAAVRRRHGPGALRLLAYSCELQRRGVLHGHLLLGVGTARERGAAHHLIENLARLAPSYGFGFVDRKAARSERVGVVAACYAAKYLTKERLAGGIGELVLSGEAPARPVYVASRLTMRTRCTMRNLRLKRAAWCRWGVQLRPVECEAVWRLHQAFGAELEPVDVVADVGGGAHAP